MINAFEIYNNMDKNNILLSFKGDITSELLTSILQIIENRMDNMHEETKIKKKVYNVLVECLQNLYHHINDYTNEIGSNQKNAIFIISKTNTTYKIITGNYILNTNILELKNRLDEVNMLNKEQLKEYYKTILNNGEISAKGGGGLGMIDIARKTGEKLDYNFLEIDNKVSFFTLKIKVN